MRKTLKVKKGLISVMGSLFSSNNNTSNSKKKKETSKNEGITDKDRAILELKNSKDRLKKYKKKVRTLRFVSVIFA
jgi:hypothetical protein